MTVKAMLRGVTNESVLGAVLSLRSVGSILEKETCQVYGRISCIIRGLVSGCSTPEAFFCYVIKA